MFSGACQSSCSLPTGMIGFVTGNFFTPLSFIGRTDKPRGWLHRVGVWVLPRATLDGTLEHLSVTLELDIIHHTFPFSVLQPWTGICLWMYHHHSWDYLCKADNTQEPSIWLWHNPAPADLICHSDNCHSDHDQNILSSKGTKRFSSQKRSIESLLKDIVKPNSKSNVSILKSNVQKKGTGADTKILQAIQPWPSLTLYDIQWPSMTFFDLLSPSKNSMTFFD